MEYRIPKEDAKEILHKNYLSKAHLFDLDEDKMEIPTLTFKKSLFSSGSYNPYNNKILYTFGISGMTYPAIYDLNESKEILLRNHFS